MSLDDIGVRNSTDKSSMHHCYLTLYDILFRKYEGRLLEIGVQFGNSLRTWLEYFPFPSITGIDSIDNNVHIDRVKLIIGDAYQHTMLDQLRWNEYEIIIDDGSHNPTHQLFFIQNYSQFLDFNGLMIVEDVPTKDCALMLKSQMPEGFQCTIVDMTEGNSIVDSRLFIMWRK